MLIMLFEGRLDRAKRRKNTSLDVTCENSISIVEYLFIYLFICLFVCLFIYVFFLKPYGQFVKRVQDPIINPNINKTLKVV